MATNLVPFCWTVQIDPYPTACLSLGILDLAFLALILSIVPWIPPRFTKEVMGCGRSLENGFAD